MDPKLGEGPRKAAASARVAYFSQEIARHHANRVQDPSLSQKNVDPFQRGSRVLFRHAEEGWVLGTVHRAHQGRGTTRLYSIIPGDVRTTADGKELSMSTVVPSHARVKDLVRLKQDELEPAYSTCLVPVRDLLQIPQLHEALILYQVRKCHEKEEVYINLGRNIVLSINPGQAMGAERYSEETFESYVEARSSADHRLPPHVWGTAHQMYWRCIRQSRSYRPQAMIFTGAAGSGKTEAAHLVLRFLTTISALQANSGPARETSLWIANMMMRLGPLIDAYGNATLQRYTNSSRVTKWTEIFISPGGSLVGGQFQAFMLERSRVILPPEGERSFHAYYHLLAGIDSSVRRRLGLDDARKYEWLFRHVVVTDEDEAIDAAAYRSNRKTLSDLGLATYELDTLDKILAGIIHLRSVVLTTQSSIRSGNVEWSTEKEEAIRMTGALWGIEPHHLFAEIASTTTVGRGGAQTRRLTPLQAEEARNVVCKAVYCGMVEWLIRRINKELNKRSTRSTQERPSGIGLLDVFGHENDTHGNMLEQLLMNTFNEEIQREYYQHVFENEIEECQNEGLDMTGSIPPDPTPTVDLVTGPGGVLSILEDQAKKGVTSDTAMLEHLKATNGHHPSLLIKGDSVIGFGIKHHAGLVYYGPISSWRSRNSFVNKSSLISMFEESSNQLVRNLFARPADTLPPTETGYLTADDILSTGTLGQQYRRTMEYIRSVILSDRELSWCRCIRGGASLGGFTGSAVLSQLKAMSVLETVRVKRTCYPVRLPHDYFLSRYRNIVRGSSYDNPNDAAGVSIDAVLNFAGVASLEDSQIGTSKVFLNNAAHKKLEDLRLETPNPSKVLTSFVANRLLAKALRVKTGEEDDDKTTSPKSGVNINAMRQTMKVLAMHLPVFLAFARGYLAHHLILELMQPEASVCGSDSTRQSVQTAAQSDDGDSSYLDKGILAVSVPLRKLAEWKRNAIQKSKQHPFEPPPTTDTLENEAAARHPDDLKGKLCSLENYIAPAAVIDQGETNFREPQTAHHDYESIILKEEEALQKMTNEELFDCLGQGKREVHAPLRLSKEAIVAIKRLVQQGELHERHRKRVELNKRQLIMEERGMKPGARAPLTPGGFPESLGPFVLRQCPPGVVTHVRDGRYTVPLTGTLAPLAEACVPGEGRVSPESPLTLPLEARKKAHIPRAAATFTWAYPLPGMSGLTGLGIENNSALQFVTFGGFIYLDMMGKPISTNAVAPGEGLYFDGPHKWTYDGSRIAEIESSGRMQPVTIQTLKDVGAKYFCWLLPGEDLGLDPPPTHGGFAYLFREPFEPPCVDDRYFVIAEREVSEGPAEAEAFSQQKKKAEDSDLIELPRIEGVKEMEGMVVHKRTAAAIDEVIKADMLVQEVRQDMEPLVPPTQVELIKHNSTVPFNDPAILSPVRHHLRDPEEFVDVEGGYLGWNKNGLIKPSLDLDYSGKAYPFPVGVSTLLSPLRSKPFFIHQMPSNSVTAFGKSVDGRQNITAIDAPDDSEKENPGQSVRKSNLKNTWLEMYDKGLCGGLKSNTDGKKVRFVPPGKGMPPSDPVTTSMAFGVLGSHAGQTLQSTLPGQSPEETQEEERATRYFDTIRNELNRQQIS